mgnify:CR=1 FL=1
MRILVNSFEIHFFLAFRFHFAKIRLPVSRQAALRLKMNRLAVAVYVKGGRMKQRITGILARKEGEGFVDTALKILISVVVGALLLAGLYALFKNTILPTLTQKITNLFNYQG